MLSWLLNRGFIAKRIVAAATGGLAMLFGQDVAGRLAELLMDPDFIRQVFDWGGMGLVLWSALARQNVDPIKEKLDSVEAVILENLPDIEDPYPGWDYDPLRGWVEVKNA